MWIFSQCQERHITRKQLSSWSLKWHQLASIFQFLSFIIHHVEEWCQMQFLFKRTEKVFDWLGFGSELELNWISPSTLESSSPVWIYNYLSSWPILNQYPRVQSTCKLVQTGELKLSVKRGSSSSSRLTRRCTTVRNSDDHAIPLRWARTPISIWVNYEWSIESRGAK